MDSKFSHGRPPTIIEGIAFLVCVAPLVSIPGAESFSDAVGESWRRAGENLRAGMFDCTPEYEQAKLER